MAYSRGIQLDDETTKKIIAAATGIAQQEGIEQVSVKRILSEMGVSNRVFYNRFCNIDELIQILYNELVQEIRSCLKSVKEEGQCYYSYLLELAVAVVRKIYHNNLHFRRHLMSYRASNESNRNWWLSQIQQILQDGINRGLLKPMDTAAVSYGVWCFCLGFHKEAIGEALDGEEAIAAFSQSFALLIEGMKPE